jgi:hypothetical protein
MAVRDATSYAWDTYQQDIPQGPRLGKSGILSHVPPFPRSS